MRQVLLIALVLLMGQSSFATAASDDAVLRALSPANFPLSDLPGDTPRIFTLR